MNKLGDVVFCVDCDQARIQRQQATAGALGAAADAPPQDAAQRAADDQGRSDGRPLGQSEAQSERQDPGEGAEHPDRSEPPRRMATKKDANGDPLCKACLDERQSRRRAEFMLADERRTVVHWPKKGRSSSTRNAENGDLGGSLGGSLGGNRVLGNGKSNGNGAYGTQLALDPSIVGMGNPLLEDGSEHEGEGEDTPEGTGEGTSSTSGRLSKAAFVRSLPATTPAKEVIARARKLGLTLTPAYVYVIRSNAVRADIRSATHGSAGNGTSGNSKTGKSAGTRSGRAAMSDSARVPARLNGRALETAAQVNDGDKRRRRSGGTNGATVHGALNGHRGDTLADRNPPRDPKVQRGIEQRFMWLAIELGFYRTQQLIDQLRTRLRTAVGRNRRTPVRRTAPVRTAPGRTASNRTAASRSAASRSAASRSAASRSAASRSAASRTATSRTASATV